MGLGIRYGSDLELIETNTPYKCVCGECEADDEDPSCHHDGYILVESNEHFPDHVSGLVKGCVYKINGIEGGDHLSSYSGYSSLREGIAKMLGYKKERIAGYDEIKEETHFYGALNSEGGDFHELFNFSDTDGMIGPEFSKKIYEDLVKHEDAARAYRDDSNFLCSDRWDNYENTYFYEIYKKLMRAFEVASNNGFVIFC